MCIRAPIHWPNCDLILPRLRFANTVNVTFEPGSQSTRIRSRHVTGLISGRARVSALVCANNALSSKSCTPTQWCIVWPWNKGVTSISRDVELWTFWSALIRDTLPSSDNPLRLALLSVFLAARNIIALGILLSSMMISVYDYSNRFLLCIFSDNFIAFIITHIFFFATIRRVF